MPRRPGLEFSRWTSRCRSPNASSSCRSSTGWTASKRHATSARRGRSTSWGAPALRRRDGRVRMEIDRRVFELYDEYCHGSIDRREFLARAGALTVAGVSALAMAQALLPRYAQAQTISFTDERMKAQYVNYPSPGGNSGSMRGYLARPAGRGPFPSVLVIHENRGVNPYIEDVARRAAVEGFLALAPDGLSPVGGYPGNDDDGRTLQAGLDQGKLRADMLNSARFLKSHKSSSGKLGVTGFCWGGGTTNFLEAALKAAGVPHQMHIYPGTQHGFHNNSTPRYNEAAAKLAWERTIAFFKKNLA